MTETANDPGSGAGAGDGAFERTAIANDGSDRTLDLRQDADGTTILHRRYTHSDQVDDPVTFEAFAPDGTFTESYTYHADHLGSIRFVTDSVGQIVGVYEYDSYGRPGVTLAGVAQPFHYTGREWDAAAELYHYRARGYVPETGRFLQEDPIGFAGGDHNIYRYVASNPLRFSDPAGMSVGSSYGKFAARATRNAGKIGLNMGSRIGCFCSLAEQAVSLAGDKRVDIVSIGEDCTVKTKARRRTNGSSSNRNSISHPGRDNHVYLIFSGTGSLENRVKKVGISHGPLHRYRGRGPSQVKRDKGEKIMFIGTNLSRAQALALECVTTQALMLALAQKLDGDKSACRRKAL